MQALLLPCKPCVCAVIGWSDCFPFISSIISLISSHVPLHPKFASSRHSPSPSALCFLALYRSSSGSFCSPSLPSAHLRLLSLQSAFLRVCVLAVWVLSCQNMLHVWMCVCVCKCEHMCWCLSKHMCWLAYVCVIPLSFPLPHFWGGVFLCSVSVPCLACVSSCFVFACVGEHVVPVLVPLVHQA